MSLLLLHYCDAPGDSRTTISAKSISQIFFVPLFPDKQVIGHWPLFNFEKFCFFICISQKFFVPLQANLDLSSIWGCSESHRSRDVKPWLPYLLGARKQKTVPSVEQAGANPARHIVAKAKEGLPSYAESNESVYWRLWFDVLKPEKFHIHFECKTLVDAHGCTIHSCVPCF